MFGKHIIAFICLLPFSLGLDYIAQYFFQYYIGQNWSRPYPQIASFLAIHIILFPFCYSSRKLLWLFLTLVHGLAHVVHPAFIGITPNLNYTPLYDFIVHAIQCQCAYLIYKNKWLAGTGLFFGTMIATAGYWAHYDKSFMNTHLWVIMSSGGVFGTQMHMMLLTKDNNEKNQLMLENFILWTLPYTGYLIPSMIPEWDNLVNVIGLFRVWYFNYFWTMKIVQKCSGLYSPVKLT